MDHRTRVHNAFQHKPVDRVPYHMFDEAGYLFDGDRYAPALRLGLSFEDQIAARLRFHEQFDTDVFLDAPVLGQGQVECSFRLVPPYDERYELHFATFPVVCGMWHPWPPHLERKPGADTSRDDRVELIAEWSNGLSCQLTIELASGNAAGYEVLMHSPEELPLWQDVLTPRFERFDYRQIDRVLAATGGDIALYGNVGGPYSLFALLFGVEQSIYLFRDDPKTAGKIMDWLTDLCIEVGKELIRHGIDLLRLGDATVSLLGPRFYRTHVLPYQRRMNQALRQGGGLPVVHACGHSGAMLESFADAEMAGVEPLTPAPLGDTVLGEAKRRVGGRLCLVGGLDPVHVVGKLTPAQVAAETRRCLEIGSAGSGYILSVADCMIAGTPRENMQAIADAVHSFRPR